MNGSNWIHCKHLTLSLNDKLKILYINRRKLVLSQQHELERAKLSSKKDYFTTFIEQLYKHYIIDEGPKTYLVDIYRTEL